MWWTSFGPAPWMFIGPMFFLVVMCIVVMYLIMQVMHRHALPSSSGLARMMDCCGMVGHSDRAAATPGKSVNDHSAFAEYRAETLRRLDDEQEEFRRFVERLRMAKDKAEFDDFMSARKAKNGATSNI